MVGSTDVLMNKLFSVKYPSVAVSISSVVHAVSSSSQELCNVGADRIHT